MEARRVNRRDVGAMVALARKSGARYLVPTYYGLAIESSRPGIGTPFLLVSDDGVERFDYRHEVDNG